MSGYKFTTEDKQFMETYNDFVIDYINIMLKIRETRHTSIEFINDKGKTIYIRLSERCYKLKILNFNPDSGRYSKVKVGGSVHKNLLKDIKNIRDAATKYYVDNNIEFDATVYENKDNEIKKVVVNEVAIVATTAKQYYFTELAWDNIKQFMGVDGGININVPNILNKIRIRDLSYILQINFKMGLKYVKSRMTAIDERKAYNKAIYKQFSKVDKNKRLEITNKISEDNTKWAPPANLKIGDEVFIYTDHYWNMNVCGIVSKINKSQFTVKLYDYESIKTYNGNIYADDFSKYTVRWIKDKFTESMTIMSDKFKLKDEKNANDFIEIYGVESYGLYKKK
ncbi:MAG: hypothetical protein YSLV7_ORF09 [Yellowstone Lake virophage 7]|uniref:hypothetical protein n=1 Tax=Yellowstone Lake virophage 7 TaxID=1557035 RepID=UPI0005360F41|nr:MAG: hypothetical protein ASQ67_gp09 [Yellowstone Lake virophage 7]AIW01928.1 MAG: hypothetical protein YSLV7_ORF09 [Yellowstone Lake virophage 7]